MSLFRALDGASLWLRLGGPPPCSLESSISNLLVAFKHRLVSYSDSVTCPRTGRQFTNSTSIPHRETKKRKAKKASTYSTPQAEQVLTPSWLWASWGCWEEGELVNSPNSSCPFSPDLTLPSHLGVQRELSTKTPLRNSKSLRKTEGPRNDRGLHPISSTWPAHQGARGRLVFPFGFCLY